MVTPTTGEVSVRRGVAALALGHGVNDLYMGFMPAILPALVHKLHLDYSAAGGLVTIITLWSHVSQPLLGYGADRIGRRHLVILGPLITALAMSMLGLMDTYQALLLVLLVGSFGNALFHPLGASLTGTVSRGSGPAMAVFAAGGNVGYGLGSMVIVVVVAHLGLERSWVTVGAGLATALFMYSSLPHGVDVTETPPADPEGRPRLHWVGPLVILFIVVMLRAAQGTTFTNFIPLLLNARGASLLLGGYAILGFSLAGAVGGLIGGPVSRRVGKKWVTVVSLGLAGPALYLFLHADGLAAAALLMLTGACLFAALPINIVMAQELLPRHASTASGLVMGLAWGVGSFSAKLVGNAADRFALTLGPALGLQRALEYSALMLVVATVVALFLPDTKQRGDEA
jgi:FSR family fosmidomycin resistance protein-like MFS transporter